MIIINVRWPVPSSIRRWRAWHRCRRRRFLLWRLNRRRDLRWSGCRLNSVLFRKNVIPDPSEHAFDAGQVTLAVVQRRVDVVKPGRGLKHCFANEMLIWRSFDPYWPCLNSLCIIVYPNFPVLERNVIHGSLKVWEHFNSWKARMGEWDMYLASVARSCSFWRLSSSAVARPTFSDSSKRPTRSVIMISCFKNVMIIQLSVKTGILN